MAEPTTQDFINQTQQYVTPVAGESRTDAFSRIGSGLEAARLAAESMLATVSSPDFRASLTPSGSDDVTADSNIAASEDQSFETTLAGLRTATGLQTYDDFVTANITPIQDLAAENRAFLDARRAQLQSRRASAVAGIEAGFGAEKERMETAQTRETGGTRQTLARAGGYLGATGSHQGVLQNLAITQRQELVNLEAQKQTAINQANAAFEDRDFELAQLMVDDARKLETEIFNRSNTFFQQNLDVIGEQRAQVSAQREATEFKVRQSNEQIDRFIDAGITPSTEDIEVLAAETNQSADDLYKIFLAGKKSFDLAIKGEQTDQDLAILDRLMDMYTTDPPVTINGVEYRGLKNPETEKVSSTVTERLREIDEERMRQLMADIVQNDLSKSQAIEFYPNIPVKTIENIYEIREGTEEEQTMVKLESGEWDLGLTEPEGDEKPITIVFDTKKYEEALKAWKTGGTFWGNDITVNYKGEEYRGPQGTKPRKQDYEVAVSKAKVLD